MTRRKHPRLWTPATTLLAGTGIALAFGISKSWPVAILAEVVTLCVAGSLYFVGGQDTGIGAVIGQQDDERQQLVALRAARLALVVVFFAVIAACVIAAAAKHAFWPFELLAVIAGISYFIRPAGGPVLRHLRGMARSGVPAGCGLANAGAWFQSWQSAEEGRGQEDFGASQPDGAVDGDVGWAGPAGDLRGDDRTERREPAGVGEKRLGVGAGLLGRIAGDDRGPGQQLGWCLVGAGRFRPDRGQMGACGYRGRIDDRLG